MFKPAKTQTSIFDAINIVPPEKRLRLENSWAGSFIRQIMPAINEELLRNTYAENGRPNKPVKVLVGLHILKESHDLTDEQVIEQFEFNLLWHFALGVAPAEAHVSQKTLHNFRQRLLTNETVAKQIFGSPARSVGIRH